MTTQTHPPQAYYSVGVLASRFQISVPWIRQYLADKGIQPAFYLNDIDHYDGTAFLELRAISTRQPA